MSAPLENQLAASLLARPQLISAVFPTAASLSVLQTPEVRAIISSLLTHGPAYANPGAMLALLEVLPTQFSSEVLTEIFGAIPDPEDVDVQLLSSLKFLCEAKASEARLAQQLQRASMSISAGNEPADVLDKVEQALREYRLRQNGGVDTSAKSILERIYAGKYTQRYRLFAGAEGGTLIDEQFVGVNSAGEAQFGTCGLGEVVIVAAKYGVGKTRLAYNMISSLSDQGAKVGVLVGEDNEATYAIKLACTKFQIERYIFEQFLHRKAAFVSEELNQKCVEAEQWLAQSSVHFFDGQMSRRNFYRFPEAMALLEEGTAALGIKVWIVDYVQMWKGETAVLEQYAQSLREFAGRTGTGLILLSQIPNNAMTDESVVPGTLPTKGSGEWGQIAHTGFHLSVDPAVGQREIKITQAKARDAGYRVWYGSMHPASGALLSVYETPKFMGLELEGKPKRGGKKS